MTTFFGILLVLLVVNAILLIFSIKGAKNRLNNSVHKTSETSIKKIIQRESSDSEYKKAV
ncbi:hypothetical protein HME9304_00458 [Flagellimonas maritima]|uniref:Uncharacterized protein n=1 Tax=Flagellimonas maritima TaxID=1383885 RepID=A0A2Z4LNY6_9FLAO|nr:hypothetical protein [Allomuricauda aurantiaca]AWX43470.1 hypothetical protein HME9304_00458 [Allomuricauda aurantiaca]